MVNLKPHNNTLQWLCNSSRFTCIQFFVITFALWTPSAVAEITDTPQLDPSITMIHGVKISDTEKKIIGILGKPETVEHGKFMPPEKLPTKALHYVGYDAFFVNSVLYGFECTSNKCSTNLDIKIGDNVQKVVATYGPGKRVINKQGNIVITYTLIGVNASLVFLFDNEAIFKIRLFRFHK